MSTQSAELDRIDAEAADWLLRRSAVVTATHEQCEFENWLNADPRHGDAFDEVYRTWEDIGEFRHLGALADPRGVAPRWGSRMIALVRKPILAAGAIVIASALLAVLTLVLLESPRAQYATAIAEIRTEKLADGTTITLGAKSELDVDFSPEERRVRLLSGEAFFEVAHNAQRPFVVDAGGAVVRVLGTKFNVLRGPQSVDVSVLEGVVNVMPAGDFSVTLPWPTALRAGQRVEIERKFSSRLPPIAIVESGATEAGSWRVGRLSYDDAKLADLVADLNRYYSPGVQLASEVAELRVTASFRTDEIPAFLSALSNALPVSVTRDTDLSFHVSPHSGQT